MLLYVIKLQGAADGHKQGESSRAGTPVRGAVVYSPPLIAAAKTICQIVHARGKAWDAQLAHSLVMQRALLSPGVCSSSACSSSGRACQARRRGLVARAEAASAALPAPEPCSPSAAPVRPVPLAQLPALWKRLQQSALTEKLQRVLPG